MTSSGFNLNLLSKNLKYFGFGLQKYEFSYVVIKSKSSSLNYLIEEIESIKVINDNNVLYEYISNDFIRVNLDIYKKYNLDLCKLNTLFQETSMLIHKNNLSKKLDVLESCIGPSEDITAFRSTPVQMHHSEIYKKYYDPHYRLISSNLIDSNFKSLLLDDYLSKKATILKRISDLNKMKK